MSCGIVSYPKPRSLTLNPEPTPKAKTLNPKPTSNAGGLGLSSLASDFYAVVEAQVSVIR